MKYFLGEILDDRICFVSQFRAQSFRNGCSVELINLSKNR